MKVGIIGGGQLARMLIESSIDTEFVVLEPNLQNSCNDLNVQIINSNYDDIKAINKLFELCDVVTYEFENISESVLKDFKNKLHPNLKFLEVSKKRFDEKNFAKSYGLEPVKFFKINYFKDFQSLIEKNLISFPVILKTNSGGYDGKGQSVLKSLEECVNLDYANNNFIIEEVCQFDFETSLIVTRSKSNQIYFFPTPINKHKNGILWESKVLNKKNIINKKILNKVKNLLTKENIVGTVAFEFFVKNKKFYFNEMAPRVHNTGHYTIDGCNVSQFRNHILAITNRKIIKPKLIYKSVMINLLGEDIKKDFNYSTINKYDYKKNQVVEKRKMGHINIFSKNKNEVLKNLNLASKILEDKNE
ncbi:5-(carboxyamino)imidazole ribonucleotide synthase [Spiroplasma gladiatoris]|uniref:5-(Carboxyamino)imidazole ribonucleotide synthase n=1 Tax=Spiroplasma gladiatoris TaxID=2143 RepID=A0A4P7AJW8_9MOLU|nr:ATP-grasp domain-containing protein [Spiroplasma gladiatoris]QBQ08053.1 5-(carboxyamino)imidazole ribonucleotide synthase [Spiroplasma gladiatoris]